MRALSWSIAVALVALILFGPGALARASTDIGQAPSLVVPELDGKTFDLGTLRGKVVIVNFWATWCPPCRQEMPALNAFYRRYHAQGLELIGLSVDRPHDRSDVTRVMQSFAYPAAMLDDATSNDFGTPSALPMTFVLDRQGVIRARLTPDRTELTDQSLAKVVLPLMAHKAAVSGSASAAHQ
jgi:cytochrome c biogenesis protein CcmG, thiol:disulfide interchange protein DsbE